MARRIPHIVHFVFGLRPQDEPFHLVHYLAITSCRNVVRPDEIHLHCNELPYGFYWDLVRPFVTLHRVDPVREVTEFPYHDPVVAHYSYAHQADFVRLDVLAEHGGMYADIDTAFVAPPRDELWEQSCVIGRERDVLDPRTNRARPSCSNALIMAEPGAPFVVQWRARIADALDGSWSAHSCFLPYDLAREIPGDVRVEPERTFHPFPPTPDGFRRLFVEREDDLSGIASVHLAAHLWWEEGRRDFSDVHARMIDEAWVAGGRSTYASVVREHLPQTRVALMADGSGAALRYIAEDAPTGYGDAADRLVRALRGSGTRVEYRGWSNTRAGEAPATVPFSRDDLVRERAEPGAPTVAHLVPEYYPLVRDVVPPGAFVAHTVWETDRIPAHWPELLNLADLVVVPSAWNCAVFAEGGLRVPTIAVPHVVCEPIDIETAPPLGLPDDLLVFYTIGRWDERKAMFHTVRAFLDAFDADDAVMLVVKTGIGIEMPPAADFGGANRLRWTTGWQLAAIVSRYPNPARVQLEVETWSPARVDALHTRGDCYVSLARGEGWGIGAFDACAYGNPVVATGWGGVLEYLTPDGASLVEYDLVPVQHNAFASYSPDQRWAEPRREHAVELLRDVARDPAAARARAAPLRDRVLRDFAPDVVAQRFADALGVGLGVEN